MPREHLAVTDLDAATQTRLLRKRAARQEIASNQWTSLSLTQVDAVIDGISSLADLKIVLKRLARYLKAREET